MPDEKNSNGKNGKSVGIVDRIKEDLNSLKIDLPGRLGVHIAIARLMI